MYCSLVSSCWDQDVENWIELVWFPWSESNKANSEPDSDVMDDVAAVRLGGISCVSDSQRQLVVVCVTAVTLGHRWPLSATADLSGQVACSGITLGLRTRRWRVSGGDEVWQDELWPVTTRADALNPEKIQEHFYTTASQVTSKM